MPSQTRQMNRAQQTTPQTPEGGDLSRMGPMGESLLSALLYGNSFMQAELPPLPWTPAIRRVRMVHQGAEHVRTKED